jgi:hypothetical protein
MTNQELIEGVGEAAPDVMEKVAFALSLSEKLVPEFAQEITDDIQDILEVTHQRMADFDAMPKTASVGEIAGKAGLGVATGLGAALFSSLGADMYDAARRGLTKSRNFNAIVRQNPELVHKYDKSTLQKSFNTLHRYGPEFTADPTLGAQLLGAMAETASSGGNYNVVKDLLGSRKNLAEARFKEFSPKVSFGLGKAKDDKHS